ncbi:hypothetical protein CZ794_13345 [Psychrobacter sp. JB385]|nr:hypothetical protein CZ794_13345 [Psychrobacter sp. JB385]
MVHGFYRYEAKACYLLAAGFVINGLNYRLTHGVAITISSDF